MRRASATTSRARASSAPPATSSRRPSSRRSSARRSRRPGQRDPATRRERREIVEFGAGSGKLAADVLESPGAEQTRCRRAIAIVEPSPELARRASERRLRALAADARASRRVARTPRRRPSTARCVMNEVLDAVPPSRASRGAAGAWLRARRRDGARWRVCAGRRARSRRARLARSPPSAFPVGRLPERDQSRGGSAGRGSSAAVCAAARCS